MLLLNRLRNKSFLLFDKEIQKNLEIYTHQLYVPVRLDSVIIIRVSLVGLTGEDRGIENKMTTYDSIAMEGHYDLLNSASTRVLPNIHMT